jgi:hypothetical protein
MNIVPRFWCAREFILLGLTSGTNLAAPVSETEVVTTAATPEVVARPWVMLVLGTLTLLLVGVSVIILWQLDC